MNSWNKKTMSREFCPGSISRREFLGMSSLSAAGAVTLLATSVFFKGCPAKRPQFKNWAWLAEKKRFFQRGLEVDVYEDETA